MNMVLVLLPYSLSKGCYGGSLLWLMKGLRL